MTNAKNVIAKDTHAQSGQGRAGHEVLSELRTNEVFVAIVGPAGAGAGTAADILKIFFTENGFQPVVIKASDLIRTAAKEVGLPHTSKEPRPTLDEAIRMQDLGDSLRKGGQGGLPEDHSMVARFMLRGISIERARLQEEEYQAKKGVEPDGNKRAFIIDSLRHPYEVALLRGVYKDAFALLGVVCDSKKREERAISKFFEAKHRNDPEVRERIRDFLSRDEGAPVKYGQHVSRTFHQSDFFVDNSQSTEDLTNTGMNGGLRRFVDLVTHQKIIRPYVHETAMHHASSAQMRSACLSRQVGAALVDHHGNIVSTGTNDVPRAGGGLYGEEFAEESTGGSGGGVPDDARCAFRESPFCSNTRRHNEIIAELLDVLPEIIQDFPSIDDKSRKSEIVQKLRKTSVGELIEFSRAVHAEMNAILSAASAGVSARGCRMYVTTFPCHYCARHIVAAGIDEVQFIEPYPKSKAMELHDDSITTAKSDDWIPPSKGGERILFHPFVGVAPKMYRRVFLKDREYKDEISGEYRMDEPDWGGAIDIYREPYHELESKLSPDIDTRGEASA